MLYTLAGVPREAFAHFPMPRATDLFGPTFRGEGVVRIDDVKLDPRYGKNSPYYGMPEGHLARDELSRGSGDFAIGRSAGWSFLRSSGTGNVY